MADRELAAGPASPWVFLVGSPRSGTTILAELLGRHPDVVEWYEPYFIWDWHLGLPADDVRGAELATPRVRAFIRREFEIFLRKSGKRCVLEKLPDHAFQIPFVNAVFPDARWVHIIRDGRDVTLSIQKEWHRRRETVERRSFRRLLLTAGDMLRRHHFWRNRAQAVLFELKSNRTLSPVRYLNKAKWGGRVGWGPRFPGWADELARRPLIEFNALQWARSVERILDDSRLVPPERWLEVRYERLVADPGVLGEIFAFVGLPQPDLEAIARSLHRNSVGLSRRGLSGADLRQVEETVGPLLRRLGYPPAGAGPAAAGCT
jgi:hypothetical protein